MEHRFTDADLLKQHHSATNWSQIMADQEQVDADLLGRFLCSYWKPTYLYIRCDRAKSNEEAKDLTQAFFAHLIENEVLSKFRPADGRLRTFLKAALKNFLNDRERRKNAFRRGGGKAQVSFNDLDIERLGELARKSNKPEDLFDREWTLTLMTDSLDAVQARLGRENKAVYWSVYENYDLGDSCRTYEDVANKLGLNVDRVTNYLSYVRRAIRQELMDRIGIQVLDEQALFREMRDILGE